jgi:hypothetical protein
MRLSYHNGAAKSETTQAGIADVGIETQSFRPENDHESGRSHCRSAVKSKIFGYVLLAVHITKNKETTAAIAEETPA